MRLLELLVSFWSIAIFSLACFLSCSSEHDQLLPPNIVWISSEDNSKHYLQLFDSNGVSTPNIEWLAEKGLVFNNAFSNGAVCSVARSVLISGCHGPRVGAQFHRAQERVPMPEGLRMFPYYLRKVGYHTSNNSKKDYNLIEGDSVWDESSRKASWRNRAVGQPFFHVFNIHTTHESSLHFDINEMDSLINSTSVGEFEVHPYHPDTKLFRYTNARYRDKMLKMDNEVGEVIKELAKDNLLERTIIFYFGDHGGVLPGSKGYVYETGLQVPLVVRVPEKYKNWAGVKEYGVNNDFVSFVDFGPTVLNLTGLDQPNLVDGVPFLGKGTESGKSTPVTYGYADRFDEKYDMVRSVRKGRYKYIRSYMPFNPDALMNNYRYKQLAYQEWQNMYNNNELDEIQTAFFKPRPPELLFDLENDPYETQNLANNPEYKSTLEELRKDLARWVSDMPDLSFYPEHYLISKAFANPVKFGQQHKEQVKKYLAIADLSLRPFEQVKQHLMTSLQSADPWERYWALISITTFEKEANYFKEKAENIAKEDTELINRVRALEFLSLSFDDYNANEMTQCLYASSSPAEALLILNSMALQYQFRDYQFNIDQTKIEPILLANDQVKWRLEYVK